MKIIRSSKATAALLCTGAIGLALLVTLPTHAQQANTKKAAAKSHYVSPPGYITGTVHERKGSRSRCLGHRRNRRICRRSLIKIVVTDDQGRFMLPELPAATYKVWVRGYGMLDSTPIDAKPGATAVASESRNRQDPAGSRQGLSRRLLAVDDGAAAARACSPVPDRSGNGIGTGMPTRTHWINSLKSGCNFCHQLGNRLTRDVKHVFAAKPELKTHAEAWEWRLGVGVRGTNMYGLLSQMGKDPTLKVLADWTEAHRQRAKCRPALPSDRN